MSESSNLKTPDFTGAIEKIWRLRAIEPRLNPESPTVFGSSLEVLKP